MNAPRSGELQRILESLNPAVGSPLTTDADQMKDLHHILSTDTGQSVARAARRPPRRLVVAVAAAVVAVLVASYELVPRPEPAFAVTPVPLAYSGSTQPAGAVLTEIAARAASITEPARASNYEHLVTISWDLWTTVDGKRVQSAVVPSRRESWRAPNNSGKIKSGYDAPQFPSLSDRLTWLLDRAPGLLSHGQTSDYAAGKFPALWPGQPPSVGVDKWLEQGHPVANGPAETLVAITDLARERLLTPIVRAAVLRTVAGLKGLTYEGNVTDRADRSGQAFSLVSDYSGLPTKYTLVVDPKTGQILDYETALTVTAGKLGVKIPAVIGYEVYLKADFTPAP